MSCRGVVAAGHPVTAEAAAAILSEGGNAFDAVLAAICAALAAEPVLASLGGGGFLLARTADGKQSVFDFFAHTPGKKRPLGELDFHPVSCDFGEVTQEFQIGIGSIAVPGMVRGLFEIHRQLGSVPMREIVAPAIQHARDGVPMNHFQSYVLDVVGPIYNGTAEALAIYGSPADRTRLISEGELMRQPELAELLELLTIEGDDLFYRGEIAALVDGICRDRGGHLTRADLERYELVQRRPLEIDYRGTRVLTNPPPSSGGILIAFALELLSAFPSLGDAAFGSHAYLDLLTRVMRLTNRARVEAEVDSERGPDAARLLDPELLERYREEIRGRKPFSRGTTHVSVIDARGNVASMTVTNGEGCGEIVPGTGIMLNNMLGEEDLSPRGFHRWRPDRRLSSMMAPSVVLWPDDRVVATGSGGSNRIRTAILQVLINLIDHRMPVESAVCSPRIYAGEELLSIEGGFAARELEQLLRDHPQHHVWEELNLYFGGAHTVERERGGLHGAGDPRRGGVFEVVR